LPYEIYYLTFLKTFYFDCNPLYFEIPIEIYESGYDAIINYQSEIRHVSKTARIFECKLLIVGNGEVGKTSIRKKLLKADSEFRIGEEKTTHGIKIKQWEIECQFPAIKPFYSEIEDTTFNYPPKYKGYGEPDDDEDEDDNDNDQYVDDHDKGNYNVGSYKKTKIIKKQVTLNIWDFGGQDIYHATHQFFLTKRSIYLYVWEARKEEEYQTFEYWFNIIKHLSDDSPVIVVMNKSDVRIKHIDEASFKEKFKNIVEFIHVSCFNNIGISNLVESIKKTLRTLTHLGDRLPLAWVEIRNNILNDGRNFISLNNYYEICLKYGLKSIRADFLSDYLHDLGVILHFRKDKFLENIVILNPEWATEAVYNLIDARKIQVNKGRFTFSDLLDIWDKKKFPLDKHLELVRLMEKFELCFNLIGTEYYIIPELLPAKRPEEEVNKFNKGKNLIFEFKFEFMPSGILTRFICRNHYIIEKEFFWKNGVVLKFEESKALIVSEPINRKIRVVISGSNNPELLAIIRKEFESIYSTLNLKKELDYKEMIPCNCNVCYKEASNFYDYSVLKKFINKGKESIDCQISAEKVIIKGLLTGYEEKNIKFDLLQSILIAVSQLQGLSKVIDKKEDSRNSIITNALTNMGIITKDQTRWGASATGKSLGELDIKFENSEGLTIGIFEAFNLKNLNRNVIENHLLKIFTYDPQGLNRNYIIIYSEANEFIKLWKEYLNCIPDIEFKYPLINNEILDVSEKLSISSEIRIGLSVHLRNETKTELYHIFVNLNPI